jgi:putative peptide zinc metalloprotease protein
LAAKVRGSLEWRLTLRDVDGLIGRLHDRGGRLLFTPAAAVALGALALAGLAAFVLSAGPARQGLQASSPAVLLFLYPATIVSVVLHELGHALATKAAGRRVNGAGVGWYWFGPMAFVDTSDMWLSGRRDRIAVSLAGPAVNAILGGAAALAGVFLSGLAQAVAWQFAFVSYAAVLINLNPLLEYDGYHVLTDLLDRPGLRRRALGWLGRNLPGALWRPDAWRQHATELAYGLASLLYVTGMVGFTAWLIRGFVEGRLAGVLTPAGAAALAWAAALLFALLVAAGLWRDLGPVGSRRPSPSAPASGRSGVGVGPAG